MTKKNSSVKRTVINIISLLSAVSEYSVRNYFSYYHKILLDTNIFKTFSIFQVETTDFLSQNGRGWKGPL